MSKNEIVIITDYETDLSFDELCKICRVPADNIHELIRYEIIRPKGASPRDWVFTMNQLKRVRKALRLRRELEMNLVGVAIVIDLLDQMDEMQDHIALLEKIYKI